MPVRAARSSIRGLPPLGLGGSSGSSGSITSHSSSLTSFLAILSSYPPPSFVRRTKWVSLLNLVGGPALIVAGFAFIPTPGPSYIIVVIGMWMLAGEFLPLARLFDRLEVRLASDSSPWWTS
jgi:hypothetical protein